jgi:CO/xanthine dehydrogenase FAD-binding subunit
MITAYHRPQTIDEALTLLDRPQALPLGGGTTLSRDQVDGLEVVDLQLLGLDSIVPRGHELQLGATVTLQGLLDSEHCPPGLQRALRLEAPLNIRSSATLAGTIVSCGGRSPLITALLALDARLETAGQEAGSTNLGTYLPRRPRGLILNVFIPVNVKFSFETVARTPADTPILCAAMAQWSSGRTRLALGGFGRSPSLAMDGTEADGAEAAARNVCHESGDDFASAEYRMDTAAVLARRCLAALQSAG